MVRIWNNYQNKLLNVSTRKFKKITAKNWKIWSTSWSRSTQDWDLLPKLSTLCARTNVRIINSIGNPKISGRWPRFCRIKIAKPVCLIPICRVMITVPKLSLSDKGDTRLIESWGKVSSPAELRWRGTTLHICQCSRQAHITIEEWRPKILRKKESFTS